MSFILNKFVQDKKKKRDCLEIFFPYNFNYNFKFVAHP